MDNIKAFFLFCLCLTTIGHCAMKDDFSKKLADLAEKEQMTENLPFRDIGQWQNLKGIFRNYVFLNFHGGFLEANLRRNAWIPDINSFIPLYVVQQTFEASAFANADRPSEKQVDRVVQMIERFHDKNRPNTSIIAYFPQSFNETSGLWYLDAQNINNAVLKFKDALPLCEILLGSSPLPEGFADMFSARAFAERNKIPTDFDTSSVHLQFGPLLYQVKEIYPDAWEKWADTNQNIPALIDAMKKYAYRPFSDHRNANTIDPRSYYFMRHFIDQAKREGRDLAFVTSYLQNIDELRIEFDKGIILPFAVNNIDLSIQANVISGLYLAFSSGLLEKDVLLNDHDLQLILESTFSLMVYELRTNLSDRPDLSLLYYPSLYQFYWFVSRTLMHMEKDRQNGPLAAHIFEAYYQELKHVMTTQTTNTILTARQFDDLNGGMFYDGFLGADDLTYDNKHLNRADDRVYTTAMAVNVLTYIWSTYDVTRQKVVWRDAVPDSVRETVTGCVKWLEEHTLTGEYLLMNSFFSWDVKGQETLPYFYPSNRFEHLNGTKIKDMTRLPSTMTVYAMEGYMEPDEYNRLLKMDKFGHSTPLTFNGYNEGQGTPVFWTSDAFTYTSIRLAVSMRDALEN